MVPPRWEYNISNYVFLCACIKQRVKNESNSGTTTKIHVMQYIVLKTRIITIMIMIMINITTTITTNNVLI